MKISGNFGFFWEYLPHIRDDIPDFLEDVFKITHGTARTAFVRAVTPRLKKSMLLVQMYR